MEPNLNSAFQEKLDVLKSYARIYSKHRLFKSQTTIETIAELLEKQSNQKLVEKEFEKLKKNSIIEFKLLEQRYGKDQYVSRCNLFLNHIFTELMKTKKDNIIQNFTETINIFHSTTEKIEPWVNLMKTLTQTPAKSMKDVYHVFNVEYQNKVEGIFKNDLRLCYLWLQYSKYNKIRLSDTEKFDLNNLKQKFLRIPNGDIPFEGYENHLRNAIVHLTYSYNGSTKTMEYRDEKAGWIREYDSFELMQLSEKLMIFNFLITFYLGILFTFDIAFCPTRVLNKSIKDFHPGAI